MAGVREGGIGVRQPVGDQRFGRDGAERPRPQRRLGHRREQLGEQLAFARWLAGSHRAQHAERLLVEPAGELGQPPQRRRVRPVHIVDHEQRRPALRERVGQPHEPVHRSMHRVGGGRRLRSLRVERAERELRRACREFAPVGA